MRVLFYMSNRPHRVYVQLTFQEAKLLELALSPYKMELKKKAARLQRKHGYKDNSTSQKKYQYAQSAMRKVAHARKLHERVMERDERKGA